VDLVHLTLNGLHYYHYGPSVPHHYLSSYLTRRVEVRHCSFFNIFLAGMIGVQQVVHHEAFFVIIDIRISLSPHILVWSSFKFYIFLFVISTAHLKREGMSMFNVESWISIVEWWTFEWFECVCVCVFFSPIYYCIYKNWYMYPSHTQSLLFWKVP